MNRRALPWIAGALVVGLIADVVVGYSAPGYPFALGLGGCVLIIIVSKWLGKVWLQRPPDYYERVHAAVGRAAQAKDAEDQAAEGQPHA